MSSKSVNKMARLEERKRLRNRSQMTSVKTHIVKAEKLISGRESDAAKEAVAMATSSIDKAVKKGIIHRNKGARLKSRLMRKVNALLGG